MEQATPRPADPDRGLLPSLAGSQVAPRTVVVILLTVLCFGGALFLLYQLQEIVKWVVVGVFLAVAMNPVVNWLAQRLPRPAAILVVYLALLLVVAGIGILILPPLMDQVQELIGMVTGLVTRPGGPSQAIEDLAARYNLTGYLDTFRDQINGLPGRLTGVVAPLLALTRGIVGSLIALISVLLISFYFLLDGARFTEAGLNLLAPSQRPRLRRGFDQAAAAVQGYLTGNLLISVIAGVATYVAMTVLQVPYAVALALLVALLDLIPLVGASLAAAAVAAVGFAVDPVKGVILLVFFVVYQQVENNILQPLVYGRSVRLHPVVVFIAVLAGGQLLGILGALIAIPVAQILRIVVLEWLADRARETGGVVHDSSEDVPIEDVTADANGPIVRISSGSR